MSNVSRVLGTNESNDKCLVFYNKYSLDSLFGAGIIKYICENITDVAEVVDCLSVDLFDDNFDLALYKNVTFVGCYPSKEQIVSLLDMFEDKLLFVTCDADDYNFIKKCAKKLNIEYSKEDSCTLNLYKIAFGEFEDNIFDLVKVISAGTLKQFNSEYYANYKAFELAFLVEHSADNFNNFYSNYIEKICEGDTTELSTSIDSLIDEGKDIIAGNIGSLFPNIKNIKETPWTVSTYNKAYAVYSSIPVVDNNVILTWFSDANIVINIYKEDKNNWGIELFKADHSDEYTAELETLNTRITELKDLLANPAQDTDLIRTAKELREKTTRYTEVSLLLNFNCGAYLEKYYKGSGTENHGYVKISNKLFAKLLETKSL